MKKKKRKRRSVKDPVLMMMMVNWFKKTEFQAFVNFQKKLKCLSGLKELENVLRWLSNLVLLMIRLDIVGLLFDDIFGEEKASFCGQNYEMSDFIVGEEKSYGEGSSLRWLKMNKKKMEQVVTICLSALDDKDPITDDANQTLNHQKQV
ncbi:hypothetical protein ES332_A12G100700v1 [Gossypium tomentosum]|uniref:Uncharacterized protein n=1 Tax=Gossypium tomentosum TaxID=34277 RepID=A0A5D2MV29_GOSTO|nr:hypothetical protein ES332_A12G100700v1 [Gossypium tomentosum]